MAKKTSDRIPLVAIVGRPNVGKSTLFNRLTGERRALVDDQPGVTRDRNYARMEYLSTVWTLVDTGGFEPETDESILEAMKVQTAIAVEEADAIVFLMDGREGLTPADRELADLLRRQKKPVFYAVNKVDGPRHEDLVPEFFALGADRLFGISSEHSYGLSELLDALAETVPGAAAEGLENEDTSIPRVAVVGRPNVGKSTLINALLGEDRLLVHEEPGTTRDAVDTEVNLGGKKYTFIDTAGMRRHARIDNRLERFSVMRSLRSLSRCHLAVIIMDAELGVVDQDARIAELALEEGRAIVILFNKWDLIADKDKRRAELDLEVKEKLPHVDFAPVLMISAQDKKNLGRIPAAIAETMERYRRRIGTGELNRALEDWLRAHPPPTGRAPLKIYYATQTRVAPPSIVFFVNREARVPEHYRRYLRNQLRLTFDFTGVPIRTYFRASKGKKPHEQ
jgi:GTP-binding protein